MKLYQKLASLVSARTNCAASKNTEWFERHTEVAEELVKKHLPRGGGFDDEVVLDWVASTSEKLVFKTSFHHMSNLGYYTGWTEHDVVVKPSLIMDITIRISGQDHQNIKDYIHESFYYQLTREIEK